MLKGMAKSITEDERPDYEETLKDIEDGINRVRMIVSDLRTFTHPNLADFQEVKIDAIFSAALRFLSHEWRDKIELEKYIEDGLIIWGNEHQLIQVIVNLLQNGFDAMRKKPFKNGETPKVVIDARERGSMAVIKVRDNGSGISSDNLGKIFDPFFTTKDVGEGMGLGLSICYRIVQAHEGRIAVDSVPNEYCEFTLELPVSKDEPVMTAHI
jgi:C4-dicarboxylate-specific signal transduction histidine kinase